MIKKNNSIDINSCQIWEENVGMIRKHNLEFDIGLHTYTLEMNQFGDMVNRQIKKFRSNFYLCSKTNEEFRKQMNGLKIKYQIK